MYLYLLHNKKEALNIFEIYKAEIKKQFGKQIKIVRLDKGEKYCSKYMDTNQRPGPFAKFLEEEDIIAQYSLPGTPK